MGGTTTPFLREVRFGFFWVRFGRKNEYFIDAKFRTWCKNVKNPHISIALIFGAILGRHSDEHINGAKSSLDLENMILTKFHKNSPLSVARDQGCANSIWRLKFREKRAQTMLFCTSTPMPQDPSVGGTYGLPTSPDFGYSPVLSQNRRETVV